MTVSAFSSDHVSRTDPEHRAPDSWTSPGCHSFGGRGVRVSSLIEGQARASARCDTAALPVDSGFASIIDWIGRFSAEFSPEERS